MNQINIANLPTSVKIPRNVAVDLVTINKKRAVIQSTLEAAINAAMEAANAQTMALDEQASEVWSKGLTDLGLVPSFNWSADIHDVDNAYFVQADVLQAELVRVESERQLSEGVEKVGEPVDPDAYLAKEA